MTELISSGALDKIAPALVKAQAEMPAVPMDGTNPFFKSKYATLGSVIETVKPVLERHGLAVTQFVTSEDEGRSVGVRTMLIHESGQWMSQSATVRLGFEKNAGQEAGALISYLRRYALSAVLGVYADEDIDANSLNQHTPISNNPHAVKTAPQPSQPVTKETGERPYKPETLKSRIAEIAGKMDEANDNQMQLLAAVLSEYFGNDDLRHDAQEYLFGSRSLKEVDRKVINAGLKWLNLTKDSGGAYVISEIAKKELSGVQGALLIAKGQQRMDDVLQNKSV